MGRKNEISPAMLSRLWNRDLALWKGAGCDEESIWSRLGWLDAVDWMETRVGELSGWADRTVVPGTFDHLVLLGMGGSSLSPGVFADLFGNRPGYPRLSILDTSSPDEIRGLKIVPEKTLFIVSSKSGTTVETLDLFQYFYSLLQTCSDTPGRQVIAITDSGSPLHRTAEQHHFLKVFENPANMGGRYSALSYFGLVPAALCGVDLQRLWSTTRHLQTRFQADVVNNPVLELSRFLAQCAKSGNGLLQLHLDENLWSLGGWVEQLLAESTGKQGQGILPVIDHPGFPCGGQSEPEFSITITLGKTDSCQARQVPGSPNHRFWNLATADEIGGEFLKWEMATALVSSVLSVNPFDQPDVESAKGQSRRFIDSGNAYPISSWLKRDHYEVFSNTPHRTPGGPDLRRTLLATLEKPGDIQLYLGLLVYLPRFPEVEIRVHQLKQCLAHRLSRTVTLGYGPRYLHSTGQLHKGGPANAGFLQLTEECVEDLAIPGRSYGFAQLHRAQADGDYAVLDSNQNPDETRIVRWVLKGDRLAALDALISDLS